MKSTFLLLGFIITAVILICIKTLNSSKGDAGRRVSQRDSDDGSKIPKPYITNLSNDYMQIYLDFISGKVALEPNEFKNLRQFMLKHKETSPDFEGVYVLENQENGMAYIGQSIHVIKRVNQHFSGNGGSGTTGSALLYKDFKNGNRFLITTVPLNHSPHNSLNELEHEMINGFDGFKYGYNRTRGNGIK